MDSNLSINWQGRASGYIAPLDGWRGIAILMVLFAHGSPLAKSLPMEIGYSGVTFFFILSGFLITSRLITTYNQDGAVAFGRFYVQRAFRLLPPLFAYLIVLSILVWASVLNVSRSEFVSSILFVRNYLPVTGLPGDLAGWFTGHFWSLAVEEHYYLFWPLVIHWAGRHRALRVAVVGACAFAFWRWAGWHYGFHISDAMDHVPYFFRTDTRIDAMLLGSAVALALSNPLWLSRIRGAVSARDSFPVLIILGFIWYFANREYVRIPEEITLAVLLTFVIVYQDEGLGRVLSWTPLRAVGKLSYSLYIWQQLFLLTETGRAPLGVWNRFPLNFAALFAAALFSYFAIEKPAIRLASRLCGRSSSRTLAPASAAVY